MNLNEKYREIKNYKYVDTTKGNIDIAYYIYQRLLQCNLEQSISPINIGFRITNSCYFNCKDCFVKKGNNYMSLYKFKKLYKKFPQKPRYIYLTGGDPFLNKEIFEIINFIYLENIKLNIHSTGIVSDDCLEKIYNNSHKIDSIQISIDSIKNFSTIRVSNLKNPLYEIEKFIKKLNDKINLNVNFVLRSSNKFEIFDVINFCETNNIKEFNISPVISNNNFEHVFDDLNYYHDIIKFLKTKNLKLKSEPFCHPMSINYKYNKDITKVERFYCPAGKTECEIDMNGDVYPCPFLYFNEFKYGNLLKDKFSDIWKPTNKLSQMKWSRAKKCISCNIYEKCGGGCYAYAYNNKNFFDERCNL